MNTFIEATAEQGKNFYREFYNKGKVVMLNLLKFKTVADYADHEHLKPKSEITGKEAYQLYMNNILPLLTKAGSRVLFHGSCKGFLIGPETEYWETRNKAGAVLKALSLAKHYAEAREGGRK